jgi:crotonobetainyl-CoA:carnitine CoA-transferase CaiB-like acyl-CoA transferase
MPFHPLAGVRVVDVTTSYAGPYCTQLLAALGADVVKVEPLSGDEARTWGPPFVDGDSALFLAANAGKRSLAIDLRRGAAIVRRLAGRADVLVQSLRPGLAEELGLGAEALSAANARLVYCSIGSYGHLGPKRLLPGYDPLAQAAGGIISVTGEPGRQPVRVGVSLIDQGTGCWAALAITAALLERATTGEGRVVQVSLYETALAYAGYHLIGYLGSGRVPTPQGTAFPSIAPYQVFQARDGGMMVAAGNDRLFRALCDAVGLPELADEPAFATNPDRVRHREALAAALEARFVEEERAAWVERLTAAGVPVAPVASMAEIADDEQTAALGILQALGPYTLLATPFSLDGERVLHASPPPPLGAHSREVLAEAGLPADEIAELAAAGIVRLSSHPGALS